MTPETTQSTARRLHLEPQRHKEPSFNPPEVIAAANDVLLHGLELLFDLDDRSYSRAAPAPFNTSIGRHYRSALDPFVSLVKGLSAGEIDYGDRIRGARIENEVSIAAITTCDILRAFKRCTSEQLQRSCQVFLRTGHADSKSSFRSDISREIAYCLGHVVHHYHRIRLLCTELGLSVPRTFAAVSSSLEGHGAMVSAS